ncbi:RagB/SusD family nutrient uptake outer membrane protein [Tellurirhabdus bombi]|uniref:RagB/SusD family nutrient uptake outer membrane protein n=1 Tax=Tellurirhabdus bombi TaxID=2907205 RepID=UPI001F1F03FE|nr:RagB/SusD family nutrient uptake outer membrane protein [Tellurirhabdus bombi]
MKTIIKPYIFAATLSVAALVSSCTDLGEEVFSEVVESNFLPTANDLPSVIAPVYSNLRPMMAGWQGYFDVQEEPADIIVTPARPNGWYDGGTYQRMHRHEWTSLQSQPNVLWGNCYTGINTVNRVIFQIESGNIPVTVGKEAILAELKVARAFYYSILLDNHGNVPIVTDFKATELPKQSSRKEVYDFVIKEVTENMGLLSENVDKTTYGRFNKWAAGAILARTYLNAEVYVGTPEWDKCIAACNAIINKGVYVLEPKYRDIFKTANEASKELIFAVPYDEILAAENTIHMKTLDPSHQRVLSMIAQPWGGNCAVPQFIDTYDAADTRLKDTWIAGKQYDPAGALVIDYVNFVQGIEKTEKNEGYRIGKYEIKQGARSALGNDFPIFRYADILMMKAECLLRKGQADEAAKLVTQVRQRAFETTTPAKAAVTGADLTKGSVYKYGYVQAGKVTEPQGGDDIKYGRFLDELGWEFAAEAHRRMDLIRFGVFDTKTWFQHRPNGSFRKLFPIPDAEMNKNSNLKQNTGY